MYIKAPQMKFLRPLIEYKRLDRKGNIEIREHLNVPNIVKEIEKYPNN